MAMHPLERKAALVLKKTSITQVARDLGFSYGHVAEVLHGRRRHPRTEEGIAAVIGLPVHEVFPPREDHKAPTSSVRELKERAIA